MKDFARTELAAKTYTSFGRYNGQPATLLLAAGDYDGGTKCQVRYPDAGEEVVPGSRVVGD